jgi:hypothetical protein|uniref:Uncharacterized protein n=1 Tax=viral metagenome TaxID=1070528 RepID=A0A6C0BEC8_9ZZZZ
MAKFTSGKITSSAIIYDRGIPPVGNSFAIFPTINFEILKRLRRFDVKNKRPTYSFFQK